MPELAEVIENLVKAVATRESELDQLAKKYQEKLNILNDYIHQIQALTNVEESSENGESTEKLLETDVDCPLCHANLYKLNSESDFLLIPKLKIRSILQNTPKERGESAASLAKALENLQVTEEAPQAATPRKLHKQKKMTCSYCKKLGHSRARCFTRLSQDPSDKTYQSSSQAVGTSSGLQ